MNGERRCVKFVEGTKRVSWVDSGLSSAAQAQARDHALHLHVQWNPTTTQPYSPTALQVDPLVFLGSTSPPFAPENLIQSPASFWAKPRQKRRRCLHHHNPSSSTPTTTTTIHPDRAIDLKQPLRPKHKTRPLRRFGNMSLPTNVEPFSALNRHHHRLSPHTRTNTRIHLALTMEEVSPVQTSHTAPKGVLGALAERLGLGTYTTRDECARTRRNSPKTDCFCPYANSYPQSRPVPEPAAALDRPGCWSRRRGPTGQQWPYLPDERRHPGRRRRTNTHSHNRQFG